MSDEHKMMDEDDDQMAMEANAKSKRGGGIISTIIKWVALVIGALIVIVTVVVITVKIMGVGGSSQTTLPVSEEFRDKRDPFQYSQIIDALRVHTKDSVPASLMVQVAFGYTSNDKSTPQEISARKVEITDFLRSYFQSKTVAELKQEEKIKIEIRNEMNDNVLTRNKIKDVRFTKYEIVEQ